jgi:acyl-CoA synthetase (AMP-forming)/AMP-acid ligase II/acyl carrier protein
MLADDGSEAGVLTFGELDRKARVLGGYLEALNAGGERALLLYPAGLDYVTAFYGCLYAGVTAVPAYPPRMNRNLTRLLSIIEDSAPKFVLTDSTILANIRGALAHHPALEAIHWIATDIFDFAGDPNWTPAATAPDTLAFLQYTSGSTSAPKGVMVSHDNLLRNEALIQRAFGLSAETVIVSWLPIYHDMGLIGNILASVFIGAHCYLMSPAAFLRRPAGWLEAISRFAATASGGPNFAYDLCVQKVRPEDCEGLDLSRWKIAANGAEPVRAGTLERFAQKFRPYGFRPEAFYPCYGMAETTLFVTGGNIDQAPVVERFDRNALHQNRVVASSADEESEKHVSSGHSHVDRVVVVDPAANIECAEGQVGEIWVADASVACGYWNKPELSAATFHAHLANTGEGPFLRTGDLGVLRNGELFVMGRLKDLIIIRGRNHYPQDIELTAEASHPALRPGCSVAFAVESDGEERLVIVAEIMRERRSIVGAEEIGEAVYRRIANEHGVALSELVLIQPATSLKTSSGKIQRGATRRAYLDGDLEVLKTWRNRIADESVIETAYSDTRPLAADEVAQWLESEVCAKLKISQARFDRNRPIAEYGLDSLGGVELVAAIEEKLGIELAFESLFVGEPSLATLSSVICEQLIRNEASTVRTPQPLPIKVAVTTLTETREIRQ